MSPRFVWAHVPARQRRGWRLAAARLLRGAAAKPPPLEVAFSGQKATHRGQRLHVGARQTEVADHVEDPVVGGQVQRCASILQDTGRPKKELRTVPADPGPALGQGAGTHQKEAGGEACFSRNLHLPKEASQAQRSPVLFSVRGVTSKGTKSGRLIVR